MSFKNICLVLFLLTFPFYANAEAWEVNVNKNEKNPGYYAGDGYGYYRRVPDKEIYYAPNVYVYSEGGRYYYQLAKLNPGEKFYPPFTKIGEKNAEEEAERVDGINYQVSLVYYPKGREGEYLRNPLKSENQHEDTEKLVKNIYPIYFDN